MSTKMRRPKENPGGVNPRAILRVADGHNPSPREGDDMDDKISREYHYATSRIKSLQHFPTCRRKNYGKRCAAYEE